MAHRTSRILALAFVATLALATGARAATWELKTAGLPTGGTEGILRGISCFSASACTAVGQYWNGSIWGASGNEWNGTSWSVASVIANPGTKNGDLRSVSCFSATSCRAAGAYGTEEGGKGVGKTLIEGAKEKVWKQTSSPNSSKGRNDEFMGISCTGSEFCLATGNFLNTTEGEKGAALAAEWEGETWKLLEPIENPGNRKNGYLASVSCIEEGVCMSAGAWGREVEGIQLSQAGSESWNRAAKKWTSVEAAEPATAKYATFYGISCKSATFCMAVGRWSESVSAGPYHTLADVWNGTKWTLVLYSGGPPGGKGGSLNGVSCPAVGECEVVGNAINSSGVEVTLAYLWKKEEWTFQSTPNPAGAKSSSLESVSCTAAEVCNAVGAERNASNLLKPFGEIL